MNLRNKINDYYDFPKKGIIFRDFSPMIKDPDAIDAITDEFSKYYNPDDVDLFAGIDARGFILASILAIKYKKGMIMIRKVGKLPGETTKSTYITEYSKDTMEIQRDAISDGQRVIICDDMLATGGTAVTSAKLIEKIGGTIVGFAFIIELIELDGVKKIEEYNCKSLVKY